MNTYWTHYCRLPVEYYNNINQLPLITNKAYQLTMYIMLKRNSLGARKMLDSAFSSIDLTIAIAS